LTRTSGSAFGHGEGELVAVGDSSGQHDHVAAAGGERERRGRETTPGRQAGVSVRVMRRLMASASQITIATIAEAMLIADEAGKWRR
jgi:hypothetical protein